jgi:hypothetical protein
MYVASDLHNKYKRGGEGGAAPVSLQFVCLLWAINSNGCFNWCYCAARRAELEKIDNAHCETLKFSTELGNLVSLLAGVPHGWLTSFPLTYALNSQPGANELLIMISPTHSPYCHTLINLSPRPFKLRYSEKLKTIFLPHYIITA